MASHDDTGGDPAIRKVQFTGGSTYTVSLPKDWARDQDLSAGASLYLYSLEDRVVVAPAERSEAASEVSITAAGRDPADVTRRVRAAYVTGADTITVEAGGEGDAPLADDTRQAARSTVTNLVGLGVASEGDAALEARSMLDASDVSLDQTVAQLRQLALSMHREALVAVTESDRDLARSVPDRVGDVDRLVALLARQFHAALVEVSAVDRLSVGRADAYRCVEVARGLAGVAEQATRIARVADEQTEPPAEPLADDLDAIGASIRDLVRTALGDGPGRTFADDAALETALGDLVATVHESADPDASRYAAVVERLHQTRSHATDIARARLRERIEDDQDP